MFEEFPFKNGFNTGDIMFLKGTRPENINVGDVIVFRANQPDPIIHRVIKKWEVEGKFHFTTKGDHNPNIISSKKIGENDISEERIIGKAKFRVPFLGYIKIWFMELLNLLGLDFIGRLF